MTAFCGKKIKEQEKHAAMALKQTLLGSFLGGMDSARSVGASPCSICGDPNSRQTFRTHIRV